MVYNFKYGARGITRVRFKQSLEGQQEWAIWTLGRAPAEQGQGKVPKSGVCWVPRRQQGSLGSGQ